MLIEITDPTSLATVSDLLHDAIFLHEDVVFDEEHGVFRILFWRELSEVTRERRVFPLVTRVESPWVRSELNVRHVSGVHIRVTDRTYTGEYCLVDMVYDQPKDVIRFKVMGPLDMTITVDGLNGTLCDIGEETWDGPSILRLRLGSKWVELGFR